jgi:hypothetical protein
VRAGRLAHIDQPDGENMKPVLAAALAVLSAAAVPALANTSAVSCDGYVVAIQDSIAIEAQSRAGSMPAYESLVCERSAALAEGVTDLAQVPVFIEELGVSTRILIVKPNSD